MYIIINCLIYLLNQLNTYCNGPYMLKPTSYRIVNCLCGVAANKSLKSIALLW